MTTKFIEGKDWKRLDFVEKQGNLHVYSAICLHCHACFMSHRSIPTHAPLCPKYPPNIKKLQEDKAAIDKIVKHQVVNNELQYLVKWTNPNTPDSWIPASKLEKSHDVLQLYWYKLYPPPKKSSQKQKSKQKESSSSESETEEPEETEEEKPVEKDSEEEKEIKKKGKKKEKEPKKEQKVHKTKQKIDKKIKKQIQYPENSVCTETQTIIKQVPKPKRFVDILYVTRHGDDLIWTVSINGNQMELSNSEMKAKYLPTLINFYETNTSFAAPPKAFNDSMLALFHRRKINQSNQLFTYM